MDNVTYMGCNIIRLFPSGYYESYIDGTFQRADSIESLKAQIESSNDGIEWLNSEPF